MSDDADLEPRLRRDLARLAERATASPDAEARIFGPDQGPTLRLVEASGRPRRGRHGLVLAALAAAAAVVVAVALVGSQTPGPRPRPARLRTAAGPRSLEPVAYVSAGHLYIASGGEASPVQIPDDAGPEDPQWSADHQWLAYVDSSDLVVHVVAQNGTADHPVPVGAVGEGAFSWAPQSDMLAIAPVTGGVELAAAAGGTPFGVVPSGVAIESIAWSEDGSRLAYTTPARPGRTGAIYTVRSSGGPPTTVPADLPAGSDVLLASWWPDEQGFVLWVDPDGSLAALEEGLELQSVALSGGPPTPLVETLVYHPWLTWSPDGSHLLVVSGSGPSPAADKALVVCAVTAGAGCTMLPQPADTVSIDPAWSPDGEQITFVRAPSTAAPDDLVDTPAWFASRRLWVENADGSDAHPVAGAGPGATLPAWSPDGSYIGYSTGTGLATVPSKGGHPAVVGTGLSGVNDGTSGPDANGKGPWTASAVWGSRGGFYLSAP